MCHDDRREQIPFPFRRVAAAVIVYVLILFLAYLHGKAFGRELYPGQYSQSSPEIRKWFRSQENPTTHMNCCSEADGVYAQDDIRDGHYWTRFTAKIFSGDLDSGWMQVPDDTVIHDPNRNGAPVVWWKVESTDSDGTIKLGIRCFAPGAGG